MALLWLLLRVRWRRAFAQSLTIALLTGAIGGFVLASAAAARRVDGTYRALIDEIDAPDIAVIPMSECDGPGCVEGPRAGEPDDVVADLESRDVVEQARVVETAFPYFIDDRGDPLLATPDDQFGCYEESDRSVQMAAIVPGGPHDQQIAFRLEGALPEPGSAEIVLTRATAQRTGLGIGDSMRLAGWCPGDGDPVEFETVVELTVTGLSVGPLDAEPPGTGLAVEPAFVDRSIFELVLRGAQPKQNITVWLNPAAAPDEIAEALVDYYIILDFRERATLYDQALDNDAELLWLLAGVGAVVGLLVLAPLLGRNLRQSGPNTATLSALGISRPQVAQHGALYTGSLAIVGAAAAVIVAVPLSTRLPRGLADAIEPRPQLWFDGAATSSGVVLLLVVVVAIGATSGWWSGHRDRSAVDLSERHGGVGKVLRLRPASQSGVSAAIGSPVGPHRASPWPSVISLTLAATTGVASLTYLAGLRYLESTPRLLGWNWDAVISFDFIEGEPGRNRAVFAAIGEQSAVERLTAGTQYPPAFVFVPGDDEFIWPSAFATGPDAITPTMLRGRAPDGPDEVAVDSVFARRDGLEVGDSLTLARRALVLEVADTLTSELEELGIGDTLPSVPDQELVGAKFEITGIAVLPLQRTQDIAQVAFTLDGYADLVEPTAEEVAVVRDWLPTDLPPEVAEAGEYLLANLDVEDRAVYLRFAGDKEAAAHAVANVDGVYEVVAPTPEQVVSIIVGLNLDRSDRVPAALTIMVVVAFIALIVYLMFFAVGGRRFELAVMRALGLSTRNVRWSIAVQATTTAVVALLVAVPVGTLIGRWAWLRYARDLDVVPVAVVPWTTLAIVCLAAVAIANAAALLPGWFAARRSPGVDLRSE